MTAQHKGGDEEEPRKHRGIPQKEAHKKPVTQEHEIGKTTYTPKQASRSTDQQKYGTTKFIASSATINRLARKDYANHSTRTHVSFGNDKLVISIFRKRC